ncbi:MAG: hypothetical protein ACC707_10480 [Thiohalomonadales bacterium]
MNYFLRLSLVSLVVGILPTSAQAIDISGKGITLELGATTRTYNTGTVLAPILTSVELWVFCESGSSSTWGCKQSPLDFPGPILEMGMDTSEDVVLNLLQSPRNPVPNESAAQAGYVANFTGHTMHFANLDLPQNFDGVPAPFPPVPNTVSNNNLDQIYTLNLLPLINPNHVGSHAYYCHVHQTKHVEMGEFGALIVHPVDKDGKFLNYINQYAAAAVNPVTFDVETNFILSTIDPNYHKITSVGDSPVFAAYNPTIFLVNGEQGLSAATPAAAITARTGDLVVIRLIGMHSVNATFEIIDSAPLTPGPQPFAVHNIDGWAQPSPRITNKVELSPGQTKDILVTMPPDATTWYPVVTYTHLREFVDINGNPTVKVLGKVLSTITIE